MVDGKKGRGFEDLEVWQLSVELAKEIYLITKNFPKDEQYGITSQIRRSVISISSNIAEGSGRGTKIDFARFVNIAIGSGAELKSQIIVARELEYIKNDKSEPLIDLINQIGRMLKGLERSLRK
jgi:four helix bundle protein